MSWRVVLTHSESDARRFAHVCRSLSKNEFGPAVATIYGFLGGWAHRVSVGCAATLCLNCAVVSSVKAGSHLQGRVHFDRDCRCPMTSPAASSASARPAPRSALQICRRWTGIRSNAAKESALRDVRRGCTGHCHGSWPRDHFFRVAGADSEKNWASMIMLAVIETMEKMIRVPQSGLIDGAWVVGFSGLERE